MRRPISSRAALFEALEARRLFAANFLVNLLTPRNQTSGWSGTAVDLNPRGDAVVIYSGKGPQDDQGIYFRSFPIDGTSPAIVQANQTTREVQTAPAVAIDDAGHTFTVWEGRGRDRNGRADQYGIFMRTFDQLGRARSDEQLVNTTIGGAQNQPDIAVTPDGRSVVVWAGVGITDASGIFFQRFDALGQRALAANGVASAESRVNQQVVGEQAYPAVAMADDGSFVVTWSSRHQNGTGWGVYYRLYHADGTPKSDERLASSVPMGSQLRSRIGIDAQGQFAIAWTGYDPASSWDIYFRRFDAHGLPRGPQQQVNQRGAGHQRDPDLAMAPDGRFIISWSSGDPNAIGSGVGSGWDVYARLYDTNGQQLSDETSLNGGNGSNPGHQGRTAVAIGSGPILGSWSGRGFFDRGGVFVDELPLDPRPNFNLASHVRIPELQTWRLPLTASTAYDDQVIGFRLDPNHHPSGMAIDPRTNTLLWTPRESDGPGQYVVHVIAYDAFVPSRQVTRTLTITVDETNQAPQLAPRPIQQVQPGTLVQVTLAATDGDLPQNLLRYRLVQASDPQMTLDPARGIFRWQTRTQQAGTQHQAIIEVYDDGQPSLVDRKVLSFQLNPLDRPLQLQPVSPILLNEGDRLQFFPVATDPEDTTPDWNFTWKTPPTTSQLLFDARTGSMTWNPQEPDGPRTEIVVYQVENRRLPGRVATQTVTIQVREVNQPPIIDPVTDRSINVGQSVDLTLTARDTDLPANRLRFQWDPSQHQGATLDPLTGRFRWSATQPGTYTWNVSVVDDGSPALSDSTSFSIHVGEPLLPPQFPTFPPQILHELTPWQLDGSATSKRSGQTIGYRLKNAPPGLRMDSVSGLLTWTPTEAQAPNRHTVTLEAFDTEYPQAIARTTVELQTLEVNSPPILNQPPRRTLQEGSTFTLQWTARDSDLPANELTFEPVNPLPQNATLSATGFFTWTIDEPYTNQVLTIPVRVYDNGQPHLDDIKTLTLQVQEVNSPPEIDPIPNQVIREGERWTYSLVASDSDIPTQSLRYSLDAASQAAGISLDTAGRLTWTPTESQGPMNHVAIVGVQDDQPSSPVIRQTFTVQVLEVNQPPDLQVASEHRIQPGQRLIIPYQVADPDLPANSLDVVLHGPIPPGMVVDHSQRRLIWNVPRTQSADKVQITLEARDSGTPSLRDTQTIAIHVDRPLIELTEVDRLITEHRQPITIAAGTRSLGFQIANIALDTTSSGRIQDALELALLDERDRPIVSMVGSGLDAFFSWTEEESPLLAPSATWDPSTKTVQVDVQHLPAGTTVYWVARLVNNDSDDTSRVSLLDLVEQSTVRLNANPWSADHFHPSASRSTLSSQDLAHADLQDLTESIHVAYRTTSYDTDTDSLITMVELTNHSSATLQGPILLAIDGLSQPNVEPYPVAGYLPLQSTGITSAWRNGLRGAPYLDLSPLLDQNTWLPGEKRSFALPFLAPTESRFTYRLSVLASVNQPPTFPPTDHDFEVAVDDEFHWDLEVLDPEGDDLYFEILVGPDDLEIDDDGRLHWNPDDDDTGTHRVEVLVFDPHGNDVEISFDIDVLPPSHPNRPPNIVSHPILEAYVGVEYQYQVLASDPDSDELLYRLKQSPLGMRILSEHHNVGGLNQGNLSWLPQANDVDQVREVEIEVDDQRGGTATQMYRILVRPRPTNLSPVFVSTPTTEFRIPQLLTGAALGPVSPQQISEMIPRGESLDKSVSLQLPPDVYVPAADIVFVVDESGSMEEQSWIASMIQSLDRELDTRSIFDARYAIVGFGGDSLLPNTIQETPDYEVWVYGPSGDLVQRTEFRAGEPLQLSSKLGGLHSVVITPKERVIRPTGIQPALPFVDYHFATSSQPLTTGTRSGFGLHEFSAQAGVPHEIPFSGIAGDIVYVDGMLGSSLASWQMVDAAGSPIGLPWRGNQDSGPRILPNSGNYLLRLVSVEDATTKLQLRRPQDEGLAMQLGQTMQGSFQDPLAIKVYAFQASAGDLLQVDRHFDVLTNEEGNIPLDDYLIDILQPDGSILSAPSYNPSSLTPPGSLDLHAQKLSLSGEYRLLVRRHPQAMTPSTTYRFTPSLLNQQAELLTPGTTVARSLDQPTGSRYFAYDLQAGNTISLSVPQTQFTTGTYRWLDAHGLPIASGNLRTGTLLDRQIIRSTGRYYLAIEGSANNTQASNFQLLLTRHAQQPVLPFTGTPITWNSRLTGPQSPSTPTEYLLPLNAGQSFTLSMNVEGRAVQLRTPSGSLLWDNGISLTNSILNPPVPGLLTATESGTYQLTISAQGNKNFSLQANDIGSQSLASGQTYAGRLEPSDVVASFAWNPAMGQALILDRISNDEPFVDAEEAASRALTLQAGGGFEDGYQAIRYAIENLPLRRNVSQHIILLTDEDRDRGNDDTWDSIRELLSDANIQLHTMLQTSLSSEKHTNLLGTTPLEPLFRTYAADGHGGFLADTALSVQADDPIGHAEDDYFDLAMALGGSSWDIIQLRRDANSIEGQLRRNSLTSAFVTEISQRIDKPLSVDLRANHPNAPILIGDYHLDGRTLTFPVQFSGDGDAWNFDLEFYNPQFTNLVYGSVPIALAAGYLYEYAAIDPDQDPLSFQLLASSDPNVHFDPLRSRLTWVPSTTGIHSMALLVSDPWGGQDRQRWNVEVEAPNPSNQPPTLAPLPNLSHPAQRLLQLQLSATDPDGDTLTYQLVPNPNQTPIPSGLRLDPALGRLEWTPSESQVGSHTLSIRVVDGHGGSILRSFTVLVTNASLPINEPPVVLSQPPLTIEANQRYRYPILALDPNHDLLTYSIAIGPRHMSIDRETGIVAWVPNESHIGSHPVTLKVSDPFGAIAFQHFDLEVLPRPALRITSTPPTQWALASPFQYALSIDPSSANLTYRLVEAPLGATLSSTGVVQWLPNTIGPTTWEIAVENPRGDVAHQHFSLTIYDPATNQPPSILGSMRDSIRHSQLYAWRVDTQDLDGDPVAIFLRETPLGGRLDPSGYFLWTPTWTQSLSPSPHRVTFEAIDARGAATTKSFLVSVDDQSNNQPPSIDGQPATQGVVDRRYAAQLQAIDVDGDTIHWALDSSPEGMTIDSQGRISWRPAALHVGSHRITVSASDAYGGRDTFSYEILVRPLNSPASIQGAPPARHRRNTLYETLFTASDVDGDPVTFRLVAGPPHATLHPTSGLLTWTPTQNGNYTFLVAATDPFGAGSTLAFPVVVDNVGTNRPPRFTPSDPGLAEIGILYDRRFAATDPDGDRLTYSLPIKPAGMSIDSSGRIRWTPPASLLGHHVPVEIEAKDPAGQTAHFRFTLPVVLPNRAPVIRSQPSISIVAGQLYRYSLQIDDLDDDPLVLQLQQAPPSSRFDPQTGILSWLTTPETLGANPFTISVSDGRIASPILHSWSVNVLPDTLPPLLSLEIPDGPLDLGDSTTIRLFADDNVGIAEWNLRINNQPVPLDLSHRYRWQPPTVGVYTIEAQVRDLAGNSRITSLSRVVRDPSNQAPQIEVVTPNGTSTVSQPTPIRVTIRDLEQDLDRVEAWLQPLGSVDWIPIGELQAPSGQTLGNLQSTPIATLDTTRLANGEYLLRIVARDRAFNLSESAHSLQIAGRLKLGNLAIQYTDLTVPVAGIPISITRSYDSFATSRSDDFGFGWKLEVAKAKLTVLDDTLGSLGSGRYRGYIDGTRLLVTLPDGREEGFTFQARPGTEVFGIVFDWLPGFIPDPSNTTELSIDSQPLVKFNDEYQTGEGVTFNPADPRLAGVFKLKSIDKITHYIPAMVGSTTRIGDRNNNELRLETDGIYSNRGRAVTFDRDHLDRIVRITDPRGNSLRYEYNLAGDLIAFIDRMGHRTTFTYRQDQAHYLHQVINSLGEVEFTANYLSSDGRLKSLTSPAGGVTHFDYDLENRASSITLPLGGSLSQSFDTFGNTTRIVDVDGKQTYLQYADPQQGLPTLITTVRGQIDTAPSGDDRTTRRTYNSDGQLLSETDPRGLVTRYAYHRDGSLQSITEPSGLVQHFTFDAKGNLLAQIGSDGKAARFEYDSRGNIIKATTNFSTGSAADFGGHLGNQGPATGLVTRIEYNPFGDITTIQRGTGAVQRLEYDENGNRIATQLEWKNAGNPSQNTNLQSTFLPNANDALATADDPLRQVQQSYDSLNRLTNLQDDRSHQSDTTYDASGRVIRSRSRSSRTNPQGIPEPVWVASFSVFDREGRVTHSTDAQPEDTPPAQRTGKRFTYDVNGRVTIEERLRGIDIHIAGSPGNYTSSVATAGTVIERTRHSYDELGRVVRTIDPFGNVTEYAYDRWDQPIEVRRQVTDSNQVAWWQVERSVFDSQGRVLVTADPYLIPRSRPLATGDSPAIGATMRSYDGQGRDAGSHRASGVILRIVDREISIVNPGQWESQLRLEFDDRGQQARQITVDGETIETLYDAEGRTIGTLGPRKLPREVGLLDPKFDGLWVRWRNEVESDPMGARKVETQHRIQIESSQGKLIGFDDRFTLTTTSTFNPFGQILSKTEPDGSTRQYEYNTRGELIAEIDPLQNRREFQYDQSGRLTSVTLPPVPDATRAGTLARPTFSYQYNHLGLMTTLRDPYDRITSFTYDVAGKQTSRTLPMGESEHFQYDTKGREILHATFEGRYVQTLYDDSTRGGGRVSEIRYFQDANSYQNGNGVPQERWLHRYDGFGRLTQRVVQRANASTDTYSTTYDQNGNVIRETSPSGSIHYQYDREQQRIRMWTSTLDQAEDTHALLDVRYRYENDGKLSQVLTVRRDGILVDADEHEPGIQPETTTYHYDLFGRLSWTELPNQLLEVLSYDQAGREAAVIHYLQDDDNLDRSDQTLLASFWTSYDPDRNPDTPLVTDGKKYQMVESIAYDHDQQPNTPAILRTTTYQWDYDSNGRLIREFVDSWDDTLDHTETLSHDLFGNLVVSRLDYRLNSLPDTTTSHRYDANDRLLQTDYDLTGDTTADRRIQYSWTGTIQTQKDTLERSGSTWHISSTQRMLTDLQGRLGEQINETVSPTGQVLSRQHISVTYDPNGSRQVQRSARDTNLSTPAIEPLLEEAKHFLTDLHNPTQFPQVVQATSYNAANKIVSRSSYTFGLDAITHILASMDATGTRSNEQAWLLGYDGQRSVRVLYDRNGHPLQTYSYSPYGEIRELRSADGTRELDSNLEGLAFTDLLYRGESFDSDIRAQFLRARWYSPTQSRFLSLDPFDGLTTQPQSLNKYAYTTGDPILYSDPSGMFQSLASFMSGISIRSVMVGSAKFVLGFNSLVTLEGRSYKVTPFPILEGLRAKSIGHLAEGAYIGSERAGKHVWISRHLNYERVFGYTDNSTGFRTVLFKHRHTGEKVLSYAGTDGLNDLFTDIWQGLFGSTAQYEQAVTFARGLSRIHDGIDLYTGHSLGGGLASTAAIVTGTIATTFNAAGVHPWTVSPYGKNLAGSENLILAYRVQGEFLSTIQNAGSRYLGLATVAFTRAWPALVLGALGVIAPNGVGRDRWLYSSTYDIISRHYMDSVFRGIDKTATL